MTEILPKIFEEDVQAKLTRLQKSLELSLGRSFAPADVEMLIINSFVYEMQLFCIAANQAFRANMVHFATDTVLEYLGELVGVNRQPSTGAECTIRFTLVDGHNDVQLPAGIRVQSIDTKVIFVTTKAIDIPIGTNTVDVPALCQDAGKVGNDYIAGKISIILDPQGFVTSAVNTDTTSGGTDAETDEQLRARIILAPSKFSVAGPSGAYKYFAMSAHPSIVDVATITTNPGEITLYPLCANGTLPSSEILDAVLAACDDEKVRPQNDIVLVDSPDVIEYAITVDITTYTGAISADVQELISGNLEQFKQKRNNVLGMDVMRAQISALCVIDGKVYNVNVTSPASDIIADKRTYPKCTGITINIIGSNDG